MSSLGLGLVVLAAMLHASWNLASKRAASAGFFFVFFYRLWSVLFYFPWTLYILVGNGMTWTGAVAFFLFLSAVLHLLYSLSLMRGYQAADLSVVYPVARGTGPLLASIAAVVWLDEPMHGLKAAGIGCVVGGIVLVATQGNWRSFLKRESWTGIRWGVLTGTLIAAYSLSDAYGVKALLIAPVVLDWISSLGGALLLVPRVWIHRTDCRSRMAGYWQLAAFVGFVSPLAYILVLYALQLGAGVSQVAPLREMSMIIATLIGAVWLKEHVVPARWVGCCIILLGVVLIATA